MDKPAVSSFHPPRRVLMGPGPSDVHPRVLEALSRPTIGHLDPEFIRMMDELKQLLRYAFQTRNEVTIPISAPGSAGMETCFVNLVEPGTLFGDRVNQFDLRLAKIVRFGRTRANVGFDLYNVLNSAPVLTYDQSFVLPSAAAPEGSWLRPTSILQPRFAKFSVQIDF